MLARPHSWGFALWADLDGQSWGNTQHLGYISFSTSDLLFVFCPCACKGWASPGSEKMGVTLETAASPCCLLDSSLQAVCFVHSRSRAAFFSQSCSSSRKPRSTAQKHTDGSMQGVEEPGGETLASVLPSEKQSEKSSVALVFFQHQPLLGVLETPLPSSYLAP